MWCGKFEDAAIENGSIDLLVSSPPYGIGKSYEKSKTIEAYREWATTTVNRIADIMKAGGGVCWQVGNHIQPSGAVYPLDVLYIPLFLERGFQLRNRLVWRFGHGLHAQKKLSGRYEVLLWFVKDGAEFTFNLDEVREPSKEPGKRSYKGAKRGELSGHPLGKNPSDVWEVLHSEWDSGFMDIPPVKNNHVEKTKHPCQFPVELAERCVLLFSNVGDTVLDPFAGVGTTGVAAAFHDRNFIGYEMSEEYVAIAQNRIAQAKTGELKTRPMAQEITTASKNTKTRQYPDEWKDALLAASKRPRLATTPLQEYATSLEKN